MSNWACKLARANQDGYQFAYSVGHHWFERSNIVETVAVFMKFVREQPPGNIGHVINVANVVGRYNKFVPLEEQEEEVRRAIEALQSFSARKAEAYLSKLASALVERVKKGDPPIERKGWVVIPKRITASVVDAARKSGILLIDISSAPWFREAPKSGKFVLLPEGSGDEPEVEAGIENRLEKLQAAFLRAAME